MTDTFLEAMNNKILTLLNLSKAFDNIHHAKLLVKLSSLGVSSLALEWFRDATFMIASSIYELPLKCPECVNLHIEPHKDLSPGWHYLMFTKTICRDFQITAP